MNDGLNLHRESGQVEVEVALRKDVRKHVPPRFKLVDDAGFNH